MDYLLPKVGTDAFKVPLLALVSLLSAVYLVCLASYRLLLHPLAQFPGPRLAAVTRFWKAYWQCTSSLTHELVKLHEIYGKCAVLRTKLADFSLKALLFVSGRMKYVSGRRKRPVTRGHGMGRS